MISDLYGIYGSSGFGREVIPLANEQVDFNKPNVKLVFIDDVTSLRVINGYDVLTYAQFLNLSAERRHVSIAIADASVRKKLSHKFEADGVNDWTISAKNSIFLHEIELGKGAIFCPFVTITSNVIIGNYFHANIYSYVAHDCVIGDFVTFAPGVKCNGNVKIEDYAYVGTGAIIKQGSPNKPLVIGRGAVVGMGAVVTKSVAPGVTVVGNPAKPLTKEGLRR